MITWPVEVDEGACKVGTYGRAGGVRDGEGVLRLFTGLQKMTTGHNNPRSFQLHRIHH